MVNVTVKQKAVSLIFHKSWGCKLYVTPPTSDDVMHEHLSQVLETHSDVGNLVLF